MTTQELLTRVQNKFDDEEGTYVDDAYILGFLPDVLSDLLSEVKLSDDAFNEQAVEIPSVAAGTPDLSAYQASQQPLAGLYSPRIVEWKLAGQDASFYRPAEGPLDKIPDISTPGVNDLEAWAWIGQIVRLSAFDVALDLRVTGDFFPQPMVSADDSSPFPASIDALLATMVTLAIAEARGMDALYAKTEKRMERQLDAVMIAMTKAQQGVPSRRFGRMNGRAPVTGPVILK